MRLGPDTHLEGPTGERGVLLHYLPKPGLADVPPLELHPLVGAVLAFLDQAWSQTAIEDHLVARLHGERAAIHEIVADVELLFRAHFRHEGDVSYVAVEPEALLAETVARGLTRYRSRDLLFRNDRAPFPIMVEWVVTKNCNRACVYCYQGAILSPKASDSSISGARVCDILTQARRLGATKYFITGGEPLLRPDSYDILVHALTLGMTTDIISKQFIKAQDAQRLGAAGLGKITLSVDSLDPVIAHRMTGIPTYATRITQTIRHLNEAGIAVYVKMVLTPLNLETLPSTLDALEQLDVRAVNIEPYGDNLERHSDALRVERQQLLWAGAVVERFTARVEQRMSVAFRYPIEPDPAHAHEHGPDSFLCHVSTTALLFGPDGRVGKCDKPLLLEDDAFILGDLRTQSVHEVWNSQRMIDALKPPRELYKGSLCYTCDDFDICHERARCHYDAYLTSGTLYGPGSNCPYLETATKSVC